MDWFLGVRPIEELVVSAVHLCNRFACLCGQADTLSAWIGETEERRKQGSGRAHG